MDREREGEARDALRRVVLIADRNWTIQQVGEEQGGGIKLLTVDELSRPMPMTLFNTNREKVRLYQALFSDRDQLPWEAS